MNVTVLGGGHGALCMAADLSLAGHEVALYLRNRDRFAETFATRRIRLSGAGRSGEAHIKLVTSDIGEALDVASLVFVPLPAYAHVSIAGQASGHLRSDQLVCLTPGTFGSFTFAEILRQFGCPGIVAAEMATLPYGTRIVGPSDVRVAMVAEHLPTGVYPAAQTDFAIDLLRQVYPAVEPVSDVLDAALLNVNGSLHASLTIMNAGPIEALDSYDIHREGSTPAILRVMAAMEAERIALRGRLGYGPPHWSIMDYYEHRDWFYGVRGRQLVQRQSVWNEKISLTGRYIEEDVRFGLSLWHSLGKRFGMDTPLADAFLHIAGAMNGVDYIATGPSLEYFGLEKLSLPQLRQLLRDGARPSDVW